MDHILRARGSGHSKKRPEFRRMAKVMTDALGSLVLFNTKNGDTLGMNDLRFQPVGFFPTGVWADDKWVKSLRHGVTA